MAINLLWEPILDGAGKKAKVEPEMPVGFYVARVFAYLGQLIGGGSLARLSSSPKPSPRS